MQLDDEDLKAVGSSTFSPAVLILMVVLLGVGIIFGWVASNAMNNREVYNARSDDAARIHEELEPRVEELGQARGIIDSLSSEEPDFEAATKLADFELAPGSNVLSGQRLLLGADTIGYVTSYMVDATMLQELLDEHKRLTTEADKEELEELMANNEIVKKDRFAVLFDYGHLAERSSREDYVPKKGRLVTVSNMEKDDEGKIEVEMLGSDRTVKTRLQGLLPLEKGEILKSGGQNALQRYQARVARIKRQAMKFDQYSDAMMGRLDELASTESAPLFNF